MRMIIASGVAALLAATTALAAPPTPATIEEAANNAYVYGLPYIEMARTRGLLLTTAKRPANAFFHRRGLANASNREVTTPNNDTLYSSAWLDLAKGPILLTTPDFGTRYWSVALMAMTTDNFAVLGTRTEGNRPGKFLIVAPDWEGDLPAGTKLVRSTTPWVWALARIIVDGPADVAAVNKLQDELILAPVGGARPAPTLPAALKQDDPTDYYRLLADMLMENPPPAADKAMLTKIAPLGLSPGLPFNDKAIGPAGPAAIKAGYDAANAAIRRMGGLQIGEVVNGWRYPPAGVGEFGTDYSLRATVALGGLAALPAAEAVYFSMADTGDGRKNWRLKFAAGALPPVDAFWSLTLYEPTPEGRLFFYPNATNKYAIGDRTPGLTKNPDGSLEILIQNQAPAGREGNWLPAPTGAFFMTFRAYLPRPALRDGSWRLPALTVAP